MGDFICMYDTALPYIIKSYCFRASQREFYFYWHNCTDIPSCLYNKYIEYMNMRILVRHVNICVRCMTMFGHTIILIIL